MTPSSSLRSGLSVFALLLAFGFEVSAQTVTTVPVGAVNIPVLGGSDTIVAIPLETPIEFQGSVASIQVTSPSEALINIGGSPNWDANKFQGFYYVRIRSGAKSGMYYAITANAAGQLTVYTAGDDLSAITSGDNIVINRFWTLNTLLPYNDTSRNPLTQSLSNLGPGRRSQIIVPNNNSSGINLSAYATYYFTSTGWVKSVAGNPSANDAILFPDEYFIIRQPAIVAADTSLSFTGVVNMGPIAIPVSNRVGGAQDNAIGLMRPVNVRLADSGLGATFVQSVSHLGPGRRDQLLVFNNAARGVNKSASTAYYRYNNQWYRSAAGSPVADDEVIPAGAGVLIRRYQSVSPQVAVWTNAANY